MHRRVLSVQRQFRLDLMQSRAQNLYAVPVNPVDPLKDVIAELNAEIAAEQGAGAGSIIMAWSIRWQKT